ncbi:phosphomannose isomerase type II C-terminal cupin domain [Monashia sp. NPDC004114]
MRNRRPAATSRNTYPRVAPRDLAHPSSRDHSHTGMTHSVVRDLNQRARATAGGSGHSADAAFTARRPWGQFEQLVSNTPVTVKILTVEPGQRLSLQRHAHRGELWRVLDEPMEVVVGARSWTARSEDSVWVPRGAVHRLGNPGPRPGRVLEVAFGHFDEDDIERLADDYAR